MARKSTGKRLRFEIFKRDGFRCVYCGATPMQKVLRVDHVVPVAAGGASDAANLVTACHDCNAGKGAVPLETSAIADGAGLVEARQEHLAQIKAFLKVERATEVERRGMIDEFARYWQTFIGPMSQDMYARLPGLLRFWPPDKLREAADIVARKMGHPGADFTAPIAMGQAKYFHGIIRRWRKTAGETI